MKRFLGIALALFLLLIVAGGFMALALRAPSDPEARRALIAQLAETGVEKGDWPGVMWAEVAPGRIVSLSAAGFADIDESRAMTPETIMPIGSISKVVVGLAAATAIEAGQLDPEAPLSAYLSLDVAWPDGAPRTFSHLATHTAGIVDSDAGYEDVGYHFGATTHPMTLDAFLTDYLTANGGLYDAGANFGDWAPGARYEYSNIGAGLAGQAIADATGTDFAAYSAAALAPLGMSAGWGHRGPYDAAATLYTRDDSGALETLPPYALATWPDGQFNASARDLATLLAVVMGGGTLDGTEVIAPEIVRQLTAPRIDGLEGLSDSGDRVGLFWSEETLSYGIWSHRLEGHNGGDPGVFTMMYRKSGTDTGFVLMLNGEPEGTFGLIRLVRMVNLLADMPPQ